MKPRILIVDDERSMCEFLDADLSRRGFSTDWCTDSERAFAALQDQEFHAVLTDINMPGMDGLQLCDRIVSNYPDVPVIVLTAFGSLDTAVGAIRAGAYDFLSKPVETELVALTLARAVQHRDLKRKVRTLSQALEAPHPFDPLVGESPSMKALFAQLGRVADTDTSVLICGETGTGKELAARILHQRSQRSSGPFVAVNCAAVPDALLESELFGHARGAFTDARSARTGLFVQADRGTLFLDEIGDLPPALQPKLLRALEERKVRPLGSEREVPIDVRLISATNRDLLGAVEEKRFRDDLYFRIQVITLSLPPLRARGADILLLAQRFVEEFAGRCAKPVVGLTGAAAERLMAYDWPGNVRQLRNVIERAVVLTEQDELIVDDLPEMIRAYEGGGLDLGGLNPDELVSLAEVERRYIKHVLSATAENRTLAAKILGIDRKTLYRKLKRGESASD